MEILVSIFLMIILLSVITIAEVLILKRFGIDVFGHLATTWKAGKHGKFAFEAFGVVAFILFQPVLFLAATVWAFGEVAPALQATSLLIEAVVP